MSQPAVVDVNPDEVLTGEAVALDVQPLGFMVRVLSGFIDFVVGYLLFIAGSLGALSLVWSGIISEAVYAILNVVLLVLCLVVLPTTVETLTKGRSIGKFAVGGRVVRMDGGAIGFRHAFIRALIGVLETYIAFGVLAFFVAMFTPRSQRLGDLAAGTYAERTRTPAITETELWLPPVLAPWSQTVDVGRLPVRLNRRMTQFVRQATSLAPGARMRIATELATEAREYVSPVPPVDPETFILGVLVVRRDREYRALTLQNERTEALTAGF